MEKLMESLWLYFLQCHFTSHKCICNFIFHFIAQLLFTLQQKQKCLVHIKLYKCCCLHVSVFLFLCNKSVWNLLNAFMFFCSCRELPDDPVVQWSTALISSLILKHIQNYSISVVGNWRVSVRFKMTAVQPWSSDHWEALIYERVECTEKFFKKQETSVRLLQRFSETPAFHCSYFPIW